MHSDCFPTVLPKGRNWIVFIEIPIPTVAPPGDFSVEVYDTNFPLIFFLNSFSLWTEIISHTIWCDNHLPSTWRSRILHLWFSCNPARGTQWVLFQCAGCTHSFRPTAISAKSACFWDSLDPSIPELTETPISWWSGQIKFVVNCLFLKMHTKMEIQLKLK